MANHSLLYTRTGDSGITSILGKVRISKGDVRLEAIGTLDELNCQIGLVVALLRQSDVDRRLDTDTSLEQIQRDLLAIGSYLAHPEPAKTAPIAAQRVTRVERWIDHLDRIAPPLSHFILPGGTVVSAQLHVIRTVCRRAERCVVRLGNTLPIAPHVYRYLNRLSDLFFAAARASAHAEGAAETIWIGSPKKSVTARSDSSDRGDLVGGPQTEIATARWPRNDKHKGSI